MARITSKFQVTVPKTIAEAYQLRPGDEIQWVPAGEVIRILPPGTRLAKLDRATGSAVRPGHGTNSQTRASSRKAARARSRLEAGGSLHAWPLSLIPTSWCIVSTAAFPINRKLLPIC